MPKIRSISQLELEGFAETVHDAEEGGLDAPLTFAEIQKRSMASKLALGVDEVPSYMEQYHRLLNADVPWKVAAFVAWSTIPKRQRVPPTQDEFARQVLGLNSDRRISEWRKNYPIDQMIADLQGESLMQYRPGVFDAIGTVASTADYKSAPAMRLFVELTRDLPDAKLKLQVNERPTAIDELKNLSQTELDAMEGNLAKDLLKRVQQEQQEVADDEADAEDDDE
jgi:hypothetical protein